MMLFTEPYSPKPRAHPAGSDHADAPPPPPKIDRANKPSQFRSAQEMLFGNQNGRPVCFFFMISMNDEYNVPFLLSVCLFLFTLLY